MTNPIAQRQIKEALCKLPSIREILKLYGVQARTQLSQNFLFETSISDQIVRSTFSNNPRKDLLNTFVIEIGAGPGLLTRSILKARPGFFIAIEKDHRFLPMLRQLTEISPCPMDIIHGDALKIQLKSLLSHPITSPFTSEKAFEHAEIMGNLPFGIATPLLFKYLRECDSRMGMTLMFQKEVANRMVASPCSPQRSRLSVIVQAMCDVKLVCHVKSDHFIPKPKVDASVVKFKPRPLRYAHLAHLETFVGIGFMHRRKTIENNLKKQYSAELVHGWFDRLQIAPRNRAEDLSTSVWVELADLAYKTSQGEIK